MRRDSAIFDEYCDSRLVTRADSFDPSIETARTERLSTTEKSCRAWLCRNRSTDNCNAYRLGSLGGGRRDDRIFVVRIATDDAAQLSGWTRALAIAHYRTIRVRVDLAHDAGYHAMDEAVDVHAHVHPAFGPGLLQAVKRFLGVEVHLLAWDDRAVRGFILLGSLRTRFQCFKLFSFVHIGGHQMKQSVDAVGNVFW